MRGRMFTIFMIVFIGLMSFGLVIPIMPYYAEAFGASEITQGLLVAAYAVAQLIAAPILGRLSDRYGRRPVLLFSVLGTFLSLLLLGFANSVLMLFASRILDGATGGNITVARAYITDITDEKNRSRGLGLIGVAFSFGFIIGPVLAGILTQVGANIVQPAVADIALLNGFNWTFALPAFVAAAIGLMNLMQVIFQLPETLPPEKRLNQQTKAGKPSASVSAIFAMMTRPKVGPLLNLRFFFGYTFSLLETMFPIYANYQLGLTPAQAAFALAYIGVGTAIVQGWAIGKLNDRYSDGVLLLFSCALMAPGLFFWGLATSVPILLIALVPIILGSGVFNTIIDSALTKVVEPDEAGTVLGVSTSLESSTRAIAPSTGGIMIQMIGPWFPGVFGAVIVGGMTVYVFQNIMGRTAQIPATGLIEMDEVEVGET